MQISIDPNFALFYFFLPYGAYCVAQTNKQPPHSLLLFPVSMSYSKTLLLIYPNKFFIIIIIIIILTLC